MNQNSESPEEIALPVGHVVEQLLFAAETIVRTSPFTDDDKDRIESALASVSDALTKPKEKPKQRDLSYGLFVPSERPLTLEEQEALLDMWTFKQRYLRKGGIIKVSPFFVAHQTRT